jgi:hypothetical protein
VLQRVSWRAPFARRLAFRAHGVTKGC